MPIERSFAPVPAKSHKGRVEVGQWYGRNLPKVRQTFIMTGIISVFLQP